MSTSGDAQTSALASGPTNMPTALQASAKVLKRRMAWTEAIVWILFWSMMLVVEVLDYRRNSGQYYWQPVLWQLSSAGVISLILYAMGPVLRDEALMRTPARWLGRVLLWHPLVCVVFVVVVFAIRHAVYALMGHEYHHESWGTVFFYETIKLSLFLGLFYFIFFGVQSYLFLVDERERAAQTQQLVQQAQLQRLTQQMQPHFLFNALNTISSLMYSDLKAADAAISRLAELLRASMELNQETTISLQRELEVTQAYAQLMAMRFDQRVNLRWDIESSCLNLPVPVMLLQTILENTFKHTVERRSGLTTIEVRATMLNSAWELVVQDDAGVLQSNSCGIGLQNLRQRIQTLFGEQATLSITQRDTGGVVTCVHLPASVLKISTST
ncbi:histidine kinase [Undibacterium cyanobacteriorum]|uniref:Histidine kinase n=1 Tax=Undibacterium cyanobacteriorum TaxID=3073561 RepID=A0ABY9RM98_9BURK|nr:histidine kinase [Undibacterium sp. 20NA77.5]WMW81116.1 histidine kinase [Undibacterium sp. 20NA77.5]